MGLDFKEWYSLTKINRIIIPIACFVLGMFTFSKLNYLFILPILGIAFAYAAAATLNDILDLNIDKISNPKRPLASNKLSLRKAYLLVVVFSVIGMCFSIATWILFGKPLFPAFEILWIALGILYSIFTSKNFITANATLGISHGVLPFIGAVYLFANNIFTYKTIILAPTLWLVLFLTYNIKDFKDVAGDKGKRTTLPTIKDMRFGKRLMLVCFILVLPITVVSRLLLHSAYIGSTISIIISAGFIYLGIVLITKNEKKDYSSILGIYRYLVVLYILSFLI